MKHILIILTISTTLFNCDFKQHVEDKVNNGVSDMKIELNAEITNANSSFMKFYKNALENSNDSILSVKIINLYSSIAKTSKYIDSLREEMNKLDDMDIKNVELVKKTFLYNGIGDSVFNKVKYSYSCTIDVAIADTTKTRLKKSQEKYSEETKKQFFEMNSPLGIYMILSGVESELINDGTSSLSGLTKN
jgi:hypothetical protein